MDHLEHIYASQPSTSQNVIHLCLKLKVLIVKCDTIMSHINSLDVKYDAFMVHSKGI